MNIRTPASLLFGLVATMLVSGCAGTERSLIFPGAATQGRPEAVVPPSPDYELISLSTRSGTAIVAQYGKALGPDRRAASASLRRPTLIFFYGNGSCLAYSQSQFDAFRRLGLNVLIPEYPGYGMSAGVPTETAFYETADAAYDYLLTRGEVDPAQIISAGWSLGGAVAIDLASRRPVSRLLTFSAFTSMPAVAHHAAPWAPTSIIIRSRFDNASKIVAVAAPILLVHGEADTLVPVQMSAELSAQVRHGKVRRVTLPGVGHNDIFLLGAETLWSEIARFLLSR